MLAPYSQTVGGAHSSNSREYGLKQSNPNHRSNRLKPRLICSYLDSIIQTYQRSKLYETDIKELILRRHQILPSLTQISFDFLLLHSFICLHYLRKGPHKRSMKKGGHPASLQSEAPH